MARVFLDYFWEEIDLDDTAKNWITSYSNSQAQAITSSRDITLLANRINHIAGRQPRVIFNELYQQPGIVWNDNCSPWSVWCYEDNVLNARDRVYRILHHPPMHGAINTDGGVYIYSNISDGVNYYTGGNSDTAGWPYNLKLIEFEYNRTNATNAIIHEQLNIVRGLEVEDIVIQDKPLNFCDSNAWHDYVEIDQTHVGHEVTCNTLTKMNEVFHRTRTTNLPIMLSWSAMPDITVGTFSQTSTDGLSTTGYRSNSNTFLNIIDGTTTARDVNTPGVSCPAYAAGVGKSNNVPIVCAVYGYGSNGNGLFRFIGPDHYSNNIVELTLSNASNSPSWVISSGRLYLNSNALDSDTSNARNKIDMMMRVNGPEEEINAYVYAARAWVSYK